MDTRRWMLPLCFFLALAFRASESMGTPESQKYICKTYGSGVIQAFKGSLFYVRSNCPFTFARFTHKRVKCDITIRRGPNGLVNLIEIIINKVKTVVQNGTILVEKKRVSLPYDHTYQHIYQYGIYTRLRSSLLPLSVTWHTVAGGLDSVWVELEQKLSSDLSGLCAIHKTAGDIQQLVRNCLISDNTCYIQDLNPRPNLLCRDFFSHTLDCLNFQTPNYIALCDENLYTFEGNSDIACAFFKEIALLCGKRSHIWDKWRTIANCAPQTCPGDLVYIEEGSPFVPSCSNQDPRFTTLETTSSCVCPADAVLNDHTDGYQCVGVHNCPCVFNDQIYSPGGIRTTRCQTCQCDSGRWRCSENSCPSRCLIEGQFVTTFDGKQYAVPGKCTYMASQDSNWSIEIEFSKTRPSLKAVRVQILQEIITFTLSKVTVGDQEITELYQSDLALIFWQSSMYVEVSTTVGVALGVQVFPELQLSITPTKTTGQISGLCGNRNNDTTDDFTTSSGIIESSAKLFALSWSLGYCSGDIPNVCINTDNEIFADEKCSVLYDSNGIFAKCHGHIPTEQYHDACIQKTCNCGNNLQQCLCSSLGSYAKACANVGIELGNWRRATNCTVKCPTNQEFSYNVRACNNTCLSLSGYDPRCELDSPPAEGCGCPEGTHLNQDGTCVPKGQCMCYHSRGVTPPGPVVIDGRQCLCEDGKLHCSKDCGCSNGKVCVHCSEFEVNTAQKTCDSLSKPLGANVSCESGCYCPLDQYEDHNGRCVPRNNCTCMYSGKVFSAGEFVKTNCKTCTCNQGQWSCKDEEACSGKCQVYGNGHYQTFDSKWYRFDGHCQYTLVEDYCGNRNGSFSVRVESVPCCDEALTCSRTIILDLEDKVTLTLSDMKVTRHLKSGWTLEQEPLYKTHTVGLYIVVSVPSKGLTLIWDKNTRITIELHPDWRNKVCGLCGNFDSNEMNDLQIIGSAVVSSPLAFGNSWKISTPPCSDVTTEIFPCERHSYCSAWAQRRCMIIKGDTFRDCHLTVDPEPYYQACVQESCSCEFEGKFLGFCTAVAAYAEACGDLDVCINWRTPDLCPVYCDYYNEQGQCRWHYESCGRILTCGTPNHSNQKLEGCYPRCPKESPYFDENTGRCTELRNCSCLFNETIVPPGEGIIIDFILCTCENGTVICPPPTTSATLTTATATTSLTSTLGTPVSTPAITTSSTTLLGTTISTATTTSSTSTLGTSDSTPTIKTSPSTTKGTTLSPTTTSSTATPSTTISTSATTTSSTATLGTTVFTPSSTTSLTSTLATTVSTPPSTTSSTSAPGDTVSTPAATTSLTSTLGTTVSTPPSTATLPSTLGTTVSTPPSTATLTSTLGTTVSTPPSTTTLTSTLRTTVPPSTTFSTSTLGTTVSTPPSTSSSTSTLGTTVSTPPSTATLTSTLGTTVSTPPSTTTLTSTLADTVSTPAITTSFTSTQGTTNSTTTSTSTLGTSVSVPETTISLSTAKGSTISTEQTTTANIITKLPLTTTEPSTDNQKDCVCKDLKLKKEWACGETWTEDCFIKTCVNQKIELTPVVCPELVIPECPRGQLIKISDGCCETWRCDCRCELYGDPHYISFSGVTFDFLKDCTYTLVEEQSPQHHLAIVVDNFYCAPSLPGSCVKAVIVKYQNNTAKLTITTHPVGIKATLNNKIVKPPFKAQGMMFETTNYKVSIVLPEIRSFVSLSPSFTLVVNLAMEHFVNNTQGQCGVCGGASCIRRGGQIEDDTCCDKTSYDWLYYDPLKPECFSAPVDVPCVTDDPPEPTGPPPTCVPNSLCQLLDHPVFTNCSKYVNMTIIKKSCEFDSCTTLNASCSSLEQAAKECIHTGFCVDWRELTNGSCDAECPKGLIYKECQDKKDDFCFGGVINSGPSLVQTSSGCFCPPGLIRAGSHSNVCVNQCPYCKGPLGEPKFPGEVWESDCHLCICSNQTFAEECVPKPVLPPPVCSPNETLVNTTCCGDLICVEKTCSYHGTTYRLGDTWKDLNEPCLSFVCTEEGIQSESVCPTEICPEGKRKNQSCCFTCNQTCAPKLSKMNVTINECSTVIEVPLCEGHCPSKPWISLGEYLHVEQDYSCCQAQSSEFRELEVECSDLTTRRYTYKHVTSCECRACGAL